MLTLYNVISEDWFIATENDSEDFIPDELWVETLKVHKRFDVLVMGRKTYEKIQSYPPELSGSLEALELRKIVITHNRDFSVKAGYEVMNSPEKVKRIRAEILVSSGPTLNNYLFRHNLVNRVILHKVKATLKRGIPVFDEKHRSKLELESEYDIKFATEYVYKVN